MQKLIVWAAVEFSKRFKLLRAVDLHAVVYFVMEDMIDLIVCRLMGKVNSFTPEVYRAPI